MNFLHPKFKSSVSCNCVAEDDYQPSNLLSETIQERDRGFMAYNVVKPPVVLTFSLKYNIHLHSIKLWTTVGSLRSTGFEVFIPKEKDFIMIGKCSNVESDMVIFNDAEDNTASDSSCLQSTFFFRNVVRHSLRNTNQIRLVITSTRRCAAVLGRVELWGKPSENLDANIKNECMNLWREICSPKLNSRKRKRSTDAEYKETKISQNIPEEFLDVITCEIMLFPMRLPCGKLVDLSTIEKHSSIEEKWGRPPSDPFTGKPYTANQKPILDATLKSRIDKFVLENSNRPELQGLPRTVGRKKTENTIIEKNVSNYILPSISTLIPSSSVNNRTNLSIIPLDEAMNNALNAIRQRSTSSTAIHNKGVAQCFSCSSAIHLYKITTCDHTVCRNCLNKIRNSQLCLCKKAFCNSNVVRIHE